MAKLSRLAAAQAAAVEDLRAMLEDCVVRLARIEEKLDRQAQLSVQKQVAAKPTGKPEG